MLEFMTVDTSIGFICTGDKLGSKKGGKRSDQLIQWNRQTFPFSIRRNAYASMFKYLIALAHAPTYLSESACIMCNNNNNR